MKTNMPRDIRITGDLLLSFHVGGDRYAVPFLRVAEVRTLQTSMPVLSAPDYSTGQINLHGRPVPLLDLRMHLGKRPRFDHETRLLVVFVNRPGADDGRICLLVDAIDDVVELMDDPSPRPPPVAPSAENVLTVGVDLNGARLQLIDIQRLVADVSIMP